jgi:hypothetical protein
VRPQTAEPPPASGQPIPMRRRCHRGQPSPMRRLPDPALRP